MEKSHGLSMVALIVTFAMIYFGVDYTHRHFLTFLYT